MKNAKNRSKFHSILPLSCHEWRGMGPKEVFYSYLVSEMIWWNFLDNRTFGSVLTRCVWVKVEGSFHDYFLCHFSKHNLQAFLMLGWPTIREGQEKSEEGNSPKHFGLSFRCPCLIRFSTGNVYIVEISSVFADNVSAMVRFEWNSVFWIITKYIFWPPLCLVRKRMKEALKWFCLSRF